jgi:hypothetical protein
VAAKSRNPEAGVLRIDQEVAQSTLAVAREVEVLTGNRNQEVEVHKIVPEVEVLDLVVAQDLDARVHAVHQAIVRKAVHVNHDREVDRDAVAHVNHDHEVVLEVFDLAVDQDLAHEVDQDAHTVVQVVQKVALVVEVVLVHVLEVAQNHAHAQSKFFNKNRGTFF